MHGSGLSGLSSGYELSRRRNRLLGVATDSSSFSVRPLLDLRLLPLPFTLSLSLFQYEDMRDFTSEQKYVTKDLNIHFLFWKKNSASNERTFFFEHLDLVIFPKIKVKG